MALIHKKIIDLLEPYRDRVSFFDRVVATNAFLDKHNLSQELFPAMPDCPMSFIWSVCNPFPDIFEFQMESLLQFDGPFLKDDQMIIVYDYQYEERVKSIIPRVLDKLPPIRLIKIDRGVVGDRAGLNWDIGIPYAENDKLFLARDVNLFFDPWNLIRLARARNLYEKLISFTTIFGSVYSPLADKWVYLLHPEFAPTPFLFTWVCRKDDYDLMGGFDLVLRRGYDQMSEMDFLLRWNMIGFEYEISDDTQTLLVATPVTEEDLRAMEFQSAIPRKYFLDRYEHPTKNFLAELKSPYNANIPPMSVSDALTNPEAAKVPYEPEKFECFIKDPYNFAKLPPEKFIQEVL